uniref:BTB domain-containing protein n=1 Tax=Strongyloides papillosus TaxID=174720 RepID=A0A0N5B408_STREA
MNSALLQASVMASASHGIHRLNRHSGHPDSHYTQNTIRLSSFLQQQKIKTQHVAQNVNGRNCQLMNLHLADDDDNKDNINLLDKTKKSMALDNDDNDSLKFETARNVEIYSSLKSLCNHENDKNYSINLDDENRNEFFFSTKNCLATSNSYDKTDKLFLKFNVGGCKYMLRYSTIRKRGVGRLLALIKSPPEAQIHFCDAILFDAHEYYFERTPILFHIIYQFYLTGLIHQPNNLCPKDLLDELEYWQITAENYMAPCCCFVEHESNTDLEDIYSSSTEPDENVFKHLICSKLRYKIWRIMEDPASSAYAQLYAIFSVFFVVLSIGGLILSSIPDLQVRIERIDHSKDIKPFQNQTIFNKSLENEKKLENVRTYDMEPHQLFQQIEYICIFWFVCEYIIKVLVAPRKWHVITRILNIIDLLSILPFVVDIILWTIGLDSDQLHDLKGAFLVVRILRVLRVIRVLKLGRYSSGLQMFGKTLHASFRQLSMMAMVVMTGVVFFATLIYYLEKDEPDSKFYSIPVAAWFTLVTMSTVGYGDMTPLTVAGKLVATVAIACGVLVLALPITIIVDNFMKVAEGERRNPELKMDDENCTSIQTTQNQVAANGQPTFKRLGPRARVIEYSSNEIPNTRIMKNRAEKNLPHIQVNTITSRDET